MLRPSRFLLAALLLLAVSFLVRSQRPPHALRAAAPHARVSATTNVAPEQPAGSANPAAIRADVLHRLAYAQAWEGELPPAMAAFRAWTERYRAAPPTARTALEVEGVALAHARRTEMLDLIKSDPQRALAVTVPADVRAELPPAVLNELETRVAGRGDYTLLAGIAERGGAPVARRRIAFVGGVEYTAHPYGRREAQLTKEGASLHGIALDGHLALHESPLRALEPGETLATAVEDTHCPISGVALATLEPGSSVNIGTLNVGAAFGRTWEFCDIDPAMLDRFAQQLAAGEDFDGPLVAGPGTPRVAADAPTSRTSGAQRVLVIRTDFSDLPGAPVTQSDAQTTMDTVVKPFYENSSYGVTTLTTTVSTSVYRLPQTGASYAASGANTQLHSDARTLASADYTLANFDRIIVIFPRLTTQPNSQITYSGLGSVGGSSVWLNGTFVLRNIAHEVGHTYGLEHANLWEVTDNNPVSQFGVSTEYNDPFDPMSSGSTDTRFDFSMWAKNHLGWLPDSAVTTITTSGHYTVYRFDHSGAAALKQPLALRIFRDGVRWYWIGLRQNFTTNSSINNGAYVTWGFNNTQQTALIGLTAPYYTGNEATTTPTLTAGLPVGTTFNDSAYNITIKPTNRGGTDPAQYLELDVTVPSAPPSVVTAWGRDGTLFRDFPTTETNVPMGLTGVVALAGGDQHLLALKSDGSLFAWGLNTNGQTTIPAGLTGNVASIAAGNNVSGVVKKDGTVQLWGDNSTGQLDVPAGLTGVRQLAIGRNHVLAVKTDGTVVGWGNNASGQLNVPSTATNVVAVAAGTNLSAALKSDGTVVPWGSFTFTGGTSFPTGLSGVAAISAGGVSNGGQFAVALKTDGTVVTWGANNANQTTVPTGLKDVIAISAGAFHTLALQADGTVVAFGSTSSGKLNVPPTMPRSFAVAATQLASYALTGSPITITTQPQSQTVAAGGSATFTVAATGGSALAYQWRKNGVAISGATSSTLTINNLSASDAASYDAIVTLAGGGAPTVSSAATLTIGTSGPTANPPRLINLSILTPLAQGETMTMGTVLGGAGTSGSKAIVARAAGPSLNQFGITAFLPDPTMKLLVAGAGTTVATNNDWLGNSTLANAFAQVGAFPYVSNQSKDAGIYQSSLAAGGYTVQVSDTGSGTGTVIAELYDATAVFTTTTPRLINVSVLKQLAAGSSMTAGFVVGGSGSKQILIRAVGPGLTQFGVSDAMSDPQLALNQAGNATPLQTNNDWATPVTPATTTATQLSTTFTAVGAFNLTAGSKDAALLVTLAPGGYTAQVTGANNSAGFVLVEVYEAP